MATDNVQIIHADSKLDKNPEIQQQINAIEQELFCKYNAAPEAINALMNPAYCDPKVAKNSLNKYLPNWQALLKEKN